MGKQIALPLSEVREIAEIQSVERVPGSPGAVAGLTEVRGRIVTLLSLDPPETAAPFVPGASLAVLLAEPHGHLGLLLRERPSSVQAARLQERPREGEDLPFAHPEEDGPGLPSGPEMQLEDGQRATLVSAETLIEFGTRQVRETFKVARDA
jgi:hypothetical protein